MINYLYHSYNNIFYSIIIAMSVNLSGGKDIIANSVSVIDGNTYIDLYERIRGIQGIPPATLNTLERIASAINNDPNFSTSITNLINNNLVTAKAYTDTQVGAEQTRAQGVEAGLQSDLSAEVSRAQGVESGLSSRISVLEQDPTTKTYVDTQVAAEASRAQGVESSLNRAILAEVSRAEGIEGGLRSDLNSEISRAQAAEGVLTTNLASEVSRAQGIEAGLRSDLTAEVSRAQGAEGVLTTDRKSTRLNSSHIPLSRMPSSA